MAFSYWWLTVRLADADAEVLEAHFARAMQLAQQETDKNEVLDRWRAQPGLIFEPSAMPADEVPFAARFNWAFRREAYTELGARLINGEVPGCSLRVGAESTIDFLIHNHCTPASVLYAALGPDAAATLPGYLGNTLIRRQQVPQCLEQLETLVNPQVLSVLTERASNYLKVAGEPDPAMIERILQTLGEGLRNARENDSGLCSIGLPEL